MIPRLMHFVWVGPPMPDRYADWISAWRTMHHGWDVRVWGDDDLDWLHNHQIYDRAHLLAPGSEGQLRSDVARYEILHRHGGVYLDCDFEPRRPLDDLLGTECFAAWETDDVWVNNAVLGAVPGHELMHDLIARLPHSVRRNRGRRPNHMTGPRFLTPLAKRHGITVHPSTLFYPYRWDELDRARDEFPEAYAVHHWGNARKRQGVPYG